jgi:hypothetical protein
MTAHQHKKESLPLVRAENKKNRMVMCRSKRTQKGNRCSFLEAFAFSKTLQLISALLPSLAVRCFVELMLLSTDIQQTSRGFTRPHSTEP